MKYKLIIDKEQEESIVIVAHEKTTLIEEIESLINGNKIDLIGYKDDEIIPLKINEIYCFYTKDSKVYAVSKDEEYLVKNRLYQIEGVVGDLFVKINQGCLVNISKIKKYTSTFSGAIKVELKNGFSEYISRRELVNVKRRMGI